MAAATTSSPKTSPQRPNDLVAGDDQAGAFIAGGDQLEEQVRRFGFEGDVADLVDDEAGVAAETDQLVLQPAGVVGGGEPVDPLAGGGEQHPVPGLAGADRQAGGEVGLAGAGRAEEHHVLFRGDEVQGAEVGDLVAFQAAGVVEVELLQALAGREPGGADPAFPAVGFPGGDLALQAGDEELLMGPGSRSGRVRPAARPRRAGWALSTPGSGRRSRRRCPGRPAGRRRRGITATVPS